MDTDLKKQEQDLWTQFKESTDIDKKHELLYGENGINAIRKKNGMEAWTKWTKEEALKEAKQTKSGRGGYYTPKPIAERIEDADKAYEHAIGILKEFKEHVIGKELLNKMDPSTLGEQEFVFTESMTRTIIQGR